MYREEYCFDGPLGFGPTTGCSRNRGSEERGGRIDRREEGGWMQRGGGVSSLGKVEIRRREG